MHFDLLAYHTSGLYPAKKIPECIELNVLVNSKVLVWWHKRQLNSIFIFAVVHYIFI